MNADSRTERILFAAAIVLHLLTAWFSSGFYAADEHYQVITFAEVKAGHEPASALPWEHAARIRSTVLPTLCLVLFQVADAVGLRDPFHKAFLLRLFTALGALIIVRRWVHAAGSLLPAHLTKAFTVLSWCLWFLPYQHVRFTSESWSGLLLLAATAELLTPSMGKAGALRAGALIGLATILRPPTVLMAMGLLGWAWHCGRSERRSWALLGIGMLIIGTGALLLDSWWYGAPTFTAWNYTRMGFEGRPGGGFEELPWWSYAPFVVKDLLVPIGLLAIVAFGVLWAKRPPGPLRWIITPFLVFHVLVPHKEMRFLFPLADLLPLMFVQAYAALPVARTLTARSVRSGMFMACLLVNVTGLVVASFTPAGSGRTRLANELGRSATKACYHADNDLVWKIAIPPFYGGPDRPVATADECGAPCPIVIAQHGESSSCLSTPIVQAEPWWARELLIAYRWRPQERGWAAYRVIR